MGAKSTFLSSHAEGFSFCAICAFVCEKKREGNNVCCYKMKRIDGEK